MQIEQCWKKMQGSLTQGIQAMLGWCLRLTVDHASNPSPKRISIPRKRPTTKPSSNVWKRLTSTTSVCQVIFLDVNMSSKYDVTCHQNKIWQLDFILFVQTMWIEATLFWTFSVEPPSMGTHGCEFPIFCSRPQDDAIWIQSSTWVFLKGAFLWWSKTTFAVPILPKLIGNISLRYKQGSTNQIYTYIICIYVYIYVFKYIYIYSIYIYILNMTI